MCRRQALFLSAALVCPALGFAQEGPGSEFRKFKNAVVINPVNMFDVINPSLQVGVERRLNTRYSLRLEGGPMLDRSLTLRFVRLFFPKAGYGPYAGYKVRVELKRSVRDHIHLLSDCYVGLEVFHTRNRQSTEVRFNTDPTFDYPDDERIGTVSYGEEVVIDKLRTGINLKFGAMQRAGKHFFVEPHVGLGLVYRDVRHYERMNPNDSTEDEGLWDWQEKGTRWVLNLPLNCKLGWAF